MPLLYIIAGALIFWVGFMVGSEKQVKIPDIKLPKIQLPVIDKKEKKLDADEEKAHIFYS